MAMDITAGHGCVVTVVFMNSVLHMTSVAVIMASILFLFISNMEISSVGLYRSVHMLNTD